MLKVFGVANHSPEFVVRALGKAIAGEGRVSILPVGHSISNPKSLSDFVLILAVRDLMHNLKVLSGSPSRFFVFGSPMDLHELEGVVPLDYNCNPAFPGFGFNLLPLDLSKATRARCEPAPIKRRSGQYLLRLVEHTQKGSLLQPLMTFIYTLPASAQSEVKEAVLNWLFSGKADSYLDAALSSVKQVTVTARTRAKLKTHLLSPSGRALQKAFADYRAAKKEGRPVKIDALATAHGVQAYEMRYVLSVLEGVKGSKLYVNSFEKTKKGTLQCQKKPKLGAKPAHAPAAPARKKRSPA